MSLMSKDIGIDLGTANIRIHLKGRGVVLNEPTVVALNKLTGEVLAVGNAAKLMLGKTPDNIVAIKPLKDGVIADFASTKLLLNALISKVIPKSLFSRPRAVVSIPSSITDVEERAVEGVLYKSSIKEVYFMEEAMAAAIGSHIKVEKAQGSMIVDIGAGTTEIAVLSLGGIVCSSSIKVAGDKMDIDIVEYIKYHYLVLISPIQAEEIKKQIGAVVSNMTDEKLSVKGRDITTGLPKTFNILTSDIEKAISSTVSDIVQAIKKMLEVTPPELASDIMVNGIVLSGGSANLKNFDRYLNEKLGVPIHIVESPNMSVVKGVGLALDNIKILKKAVKTKKDR